MPRRFTLNPEEDQEAYNYKPSQFSRKVKSGFEFEENDPRFSPQTKRAIGYRPQEEEEEDDDPYGYGDAISRYRKELGGEQPALAKYRQALQDTPRMQDYDLGKWGKVGAALAGFGAGYQDPVKGVAVAKSLREAPWKTALEQHDRDLEGLGTEAEFEQDDRKNRMAGVKLELDTIDKRRDDDRNDLNIGSQIQRRREQTKNELSRLGLDWKKYDLDYLDRLDDNERADLIAAETAKHNRETEGTARGQLSVARQNANTATGRLNFQMGPEFDETVQTNMFNRFMDEKEETGRNQRDGTGSDSWVTPNVQRDAEDTVATTFYRDPMYRKFLIPDAGGRIIINPNLDESETNTPEYEAFELAMAGEIDKVINTKRGQGTGIYRRVP